MLCASAIITASVHSVACKMLRGDKHKFQLHAYLSCDRVCNGGFATFVLACYHPMLPCHVLQQDCSVSIVPRTVHKAKSRIAHQLATCVTLCRNSGSSGVTGSYQLINNFRMWCCCQQPLALQKHAEQPPAPCWTGVSGDR